MVFSRNLCEKSKKRHPLVAPDERSIFSCQISLDSYDFREIEDGDFYKHERKNLEESIRL